MSLAKGRSELVPSPPGSVVAGEVGAAETAAIAGEFSEASRQFLRSRPAPGRDAEAHFTSPHRHVCCQADRINCRCHRG
jgi:hypothetical protein